MDFYYDEQIRRYLLQFIRIFSDYKIQYGPDEDGTITQKRVPIIYGDPSALVAQILKGGSENTLMPSPMMSVWINNFEMAPDRRRDPAFEGKINAYERNWDKTTRSYGEDVGDRYTIDRYMPVPYDITFQLDIWTTTTTTKLQLFEQITTIFNPMVQLQQNSNLFDWTSIFEVELTDITWTNRSIPQGSDLERDICSLLFKVPIWISPPAKVQTIKMIEQIVTNIHAGIDIPDTDDIDSIEDPFGCIGNPLTTVVVTPGNFRISIGIDGYANNEVVLRNQYGVADPSLSWESLFQTYGNIEENVTRLVISLADIIGPHESVIYGTVTLDEDKPNVLIYDIDPDTLPGTTLDPILGRVDPVVNWPGKGLPEEQIGQRYMISNNDIPDVNPWGVSAVVNDIISFDGESWNVAFDSALAEESQIIVDLSTDNYYSWNITDQDWEYTFLGEYCPGYWRLENLNSNSPIIIDPDNGGIDLPIITDPTCPR